MSSVTLKDGEKVIIVLTGSLGDVARGLIVPSIIKEQRPDIEIHWLIEKKWRGIVELSSAVDRIIEFDRSSPLKGVGVMKQELRDSGPYGCTLDMQRHFKSGYFSKLTGAPIRIGFSRGDAKEFNWIFNNRYINKIDNSISKVHHYLSFIESMGLEIPSDPQFKMDKEFVEKKAVRFLEQSEGKIITCVLGSSWESKDWFKSGYVKLIEQLQELPDTTVALTGDRSQVELATEIESYAKKPLLNLVAKTDLQELCGVLHASAIAVGPDTGPGHLAALYGTKYITLFGPTDPPRVVPFGSEALAQVPNVPCHPCWRRKCPGLDKVCMRLHSPDNIARVVQANLAA